MQHIQNGESGVLVRTKINSAILKAAELKWYSDALKAKVGVDRLDLFNSIFADGTPGFRINVEEAIRLNQQALGPELVTNGDFSDGLTGWSSSTSHPTANTLVDGHVRIEKTSDTVNVGRIYRTVSLEIGKTYRISADLIGASATTASISVGIGAQTLSYLTASGSGQVSMVWTATDAAPVVRVNTPAAAAGSWAEWDNVSVREIDLSKCVAFQDSAGTLPVMSMEQPLGLILDTKAGVPVLGPELVPSLSFDSDIADVTFAARGTKEWNAGALRLVTTEPNGAFGVVAATSTLPISTGVLQEVVVVLRTMSVAVSGHRIGVYLSTGQNTAVSTIGVQMSSPGTYRFLKPANSTLKILTIRSELGAATIGDVFEIESISVREIPGNHFVQPSNTASRPIVSRRVNLLTASEQFDDAAWPKTRCTVTPNAALAPNGMLTADKLVEGTGGDTKQLLRFITVPSGVKYTFSISAKPAEHSRLAIQLPTTGIAVIDFATGNVVNGATGMDIAIKPQDNGYYRVFIRGESNGSSSQFVLIRLSKPGSGIGWEGDGTSGIYIWGADLRLAADAIPSIPAYQRVTTDSDYDETGFPAYARFDGVDDWLETVGTVDMSSTDAVTVMSGVTKLSDAGSGMVLEHGSDIDVQRSIHPTLCARRWRRRQICGWLPRVGARVPCGHHVNRLQRAIQSSAYRNRQDQHRHGSSSHQRRSSRHKQRRSRHRQLWRSQVLYGPPWWCHCHIQRPHLRRDGGWQAADRWPACSGRASRAVAGEVVLMSVATYKVSDGFVVSDEGIWIPGVYDTENAAIAAASLPPESVQTMWDQVLASGRDTATIFDVESYK